MGKGQSIDHAKHNEATCKYLHAKGDSPDWVVTTAYYSAMHYVCAELFPGQYYSQNKKKDRQFTCFAEYYNDMQYSVNKHRALLELVEEFMPEIYDEFKTLKDMCWSARYVDYNITPEEAKIAVDTLNNIKGICTPVDTGALRKKVLSSDKETTHQKPREATESNAETKK
jgi:hypothetical protein